jgi:hypothetical protein
MLPDTRTVRILLATPPGERIATLACFTMGSPLIALLAALMA